MKKIYNPNKVLMMQYYDFYGTSMPLLNDEAMKPSEEVVKNILDFASSYQAVEAGGMQFELYLN